MNCTKYARFNSRIEFNLHNLISVCIVPGQGNNREKERKIERERVRERAALSSGQENNLREGERERGTGEQRNLGSLLGKQEGGDMCLFPVLWESQIIDDNQHIFKQLDISLRLSQ